LFKKKRLTKKSFTALSTTLLTFPLSSREQAFETSY
jgi:hypothetical protein